MYKELIIATIIIITIFGMDFITQKYTDKAVRETISNLTYIQEKISDENIDNEKTVKNMLDVHKKWINYHIPLAFYLEHNELEKIDTSFVAGKSYIESKKYEDAHSELEKTIFVLQHIKDKYSIKWENIF